MLLTNDAVASIGTLKTQEHETVQSGPSRKWDLVWFRKKVTDLWCKMQCFLERGFKTMPGSSFSPRVIQKQCVPRHKSCHSVQRKSKGNEKKEEGR